MSDARETMQARVAAVKAAVSLSAVIGRVVKLKRRGREDSGLCPFHQERSPSFTVVAEKGFAHCFGCGWHGDAIRFVMDHQGLQFIDALKLLEGDAGLIAESATRRESTKPTGPRDDYVDGRQAAAVVWREAKRARGTIAERWFEARGIDPKASGAMDVLRFHPRCPGRLWRTWEHHGDVRRNAPALLAPILRVSGDRGERALSLAGVHITFLSGDGRRKAQFETWSDRETGEIHSPPTRLMWGAAARGAVLMPAAPLAPNADVVSEMVRLIDADGRLVVGEGIESTLSLLALQDGARLGAATLSLGNLEGQPVRVGKHDAIPLWNMRGDPERQVPFTLAAPGSVVIGVDADMKPTRPVWVQDAKGAFAVQRAMNSRERAERCAALAAWHWRQAGATAVRTVRPPMGEDFNDFDQRRMA